MTICESQGYEGLSKRLTAWTAVVGVLLEHLSSALGANDTWVTLSLLSPLDRIFERGEETRSEGFHYTVFGLAASKLRTYFSASKSLALAA